LRVARGVRNGEPQLRAHGFARGTRDYIKNMITGAAQMDGAIWGLQPPMDRCGKTREHILLARQGGVPAIGRV